MFGLITKTGINCLQMITFPFNTTVMMVWTSNATLVGISDFINNFSITNFNKIFWLDVLFVTYIFTKGDNVFKNVDDEAVELFF